MTRHGRSWTIYSPTTVTKIINGKHLCRSWRHIWSLLLPCTICTLTVSCYVHCDYSQPCRWETTFLFGQMQGTTDDIHMRGRSRKSWTGNAMEWTSLTMIDILVKAADTLAWRLFLPSGQNILLSRRKFD